MNTVKSLRNLTTDYAFDSISFYVLPKHNWDIWMALEIIITQNRNNYDLYFTPLFNRLKRVLCARRALGNRPSRPPLVAPPGLVVVQPVPVYGVWFVSYGHVSAVVTPEIAGLYYHRGSSSDVTIHARIASSIRWRTARSVFLTENSVLRSDGGTATRRTVNRYVQNNVAPLSLVVSF